MMSVMVMTAPWLASLLSRESRDLAGLHEAPGPAALCLVEPELVDVMQEPGQRDVELLHLDRCHLCAVDTEPPQVLECREAEPPGVTWLLDDDRLALRVPGETPHLARCGLRIDRVGIPLGAYKRVAQRGLCEERWHWRIHQAVGGQTDVCRGRLAISVVVALAPHAHHVRAEVAADRG